MFDGLRGVEVCVWSDVSWSDALLLLTDNAEALAYASASLRALTGADGINRDKSNKEHTVFNELVIVHIVRPCNWKALRRGYVERLTDLGA